VVTQLYDGIALSSHQLLDSEQAILLRLLEGHTDSLRFRCDTWQFAINLRDLEHQNLSVTALQALLHLGLIRHGIEGDSEAADRKIDLVEHRRLTSESCFILSHEGVQVAYSFAPRDPRANGQQPGVGASVVLPSFLKNPDGSRTLAFVGQVVRVFRKYAQFQEKVLESFQAEGWPVRIADPLPHTSHVNPKTRLHEVITRLNSKQDTPLLRFHGDGSGQGACWKIR
jgi:hypothetical protein